jgi:hypothetical protein
MRPSSRDTIPPLFLARRLSLARHRVLQRVGDDHVAHLDRLHGHAPWVRALVDQFLQLVFDPFAALEKIGE